MALAVEAKGSTFFQGFLPSPETGVCHEVITKPVEGQGCVLLSVYEYLPHSILPKIYQHVFMVFLEVLLVG
jgi:hypothetical protein